MYQDVLTSDSGFVENEEVMTTNTFTDVELLYSNPKTHSRLFKATLRGKRFVLKGLKEEYSAHPSYRELLNKEFEIGYPLSHPNIAATYGMHYVEGIGEVIAIEYVDGITLAEALKSGSITAAMARNIISEICDAMHYMHSLQVIHRDLKPENIMLTHNGNHVKIIDFGLADSDAYTIFKQPAGTRRYASPELVEGRKIDNRSDIYSLGVIISLMLHDKRARKIAKRCMDVERDYRYADASEVKSDLLRPSHKALYIGGAIALLLVVGIAIAAYNIGLQSASKQRNTVARIAQAVDSRSVDEERFNRVIAEVDGIIDSLLTPHYSRLSNIRTIRDLDDFVDDYEPLARHIKSLAEERFAQIVDSQSTAYATYESYLSQHIEHRLHKIYQQHLPAIEDLASMYLK